MSEKITSGDDGIIKGAFDFAEQQARIRRSKFEVVKPNTEQQLPELKICSSDIESLEQCAELLLGSFKEKRSMPNFEPPDPSAA